ncbi:MAG: purine-nucleoside phosphorylase [Salinivirgaceae bacterium]|nr:purine-nucleoside phosphorylase [Salinivirgaceae bacterium]
MIEKFKKTADFILEGLNYKPEIGIVLGSGLGGLGDRIEADKVIRYEDIPDFPVSTVEGHQGKLILGTLGGKKIVAMQGRFHYYEGYSMDMVTFPIRVMKFLGIEYLFVSNAAGGMNPEFNVGDIMLIKDHINHFPINPLIGKNNPELGSRFPDMSKVYNKELITKAKEIAKKHNISLQEGVYIGSTGPTLETPAEYKMFRIWGADATGMSTVPEVIVAHHMGIKCLGMSVITNIDKPAHPDGETTHDEVQNVAGDVEPKMTLLIKELLSSL